MALVALLVKQFPEVREKIISVAASADLNILSIHDETKKLAIFQMQSPENSLSIENVESFAWQEDNYSQTNYNLLVVNDKAEIHYYSIDVNGFESAILEKKQIAKWDVNSIFQSFQELKKNLGSVSSIEILKFEAREAIFLFDGKVVVSFFPCSEEYVQIMSIVDLRDDSPRHRKVLLVKDTLLALNEEGTKLFVYSFLNNSKLSEVVFSNCSSKFTDGRPVHNFFVNTKLTLLVLVTADGSVHSMSVDLLGSMPQVPQTGGMITAFTKHFPSVRRLNEGLRRCSTSSLLSVDVSDSFTDLAVLDNKLCFLCDSEDGQAVLTVHVLDDERHVINTKLPQSAVFVKSGSEVPYPLLMFSGSRMFLLLYDTEQDKLVNELMIYPSSGAVEILSALNNWNSIHMDIKVLSLGLSNRQLYTVQFFLKTLLEGFCLLWNSAMSEQWVQKVRKEHSLWESVLEVVLDNIYKNLEDSYACQYAEQLLQVSIGMVIQMLSVIEAKEASEEKDAFMTTFSQALLKMRKLLRENSTAHESDVEESAAKYSEEILQQWKKWEKLSSDEVIENSILNGCIPMAQSYFCCYKDDPSKGSYSEFERVSENLLILYLRQDCMDKAIAVLLNMGIDLNSKLLKIFKSTCEKDVRALMTKELCSRRLLSETDMQSLQFVSLLEKFYPCTSFEHAQILLHEKHALSTEVACAVTEETAESLPVGDFMDFNQDNSESGAYCRIVLDWLSSWDADTRGRMLAPLYLKNSSVLDSFPKESDEVYKLSVWYYLLEHGNLPYLMNWIDIWLGFHPRDSDGFSTLDRWPISREMVNKIPEKATLHVAESLLNALAKYGIFCDKELENTSLFLNRMGKAQCDINDLSSFTSDKASLSLSDLCHSLVHYCLKHNLVQFLYSLLSKSCVVPSCQECDVLVLSLTKAFYSWSQNHNDTQLAYDAVTSAAQYVFQLPSVSCSDILCSVPLPLALGIFLLRPQPLSESIGLCSGTAVRDKFRSHPVLYDFIFKTPEERARPDITVYGLLKGNSVLDASQLFGWQAANALKSEESQNELPHFSLQSLSEQYGLKKELSYLYYLMEGRPNYSYLKFVAQEVVLETGMSISRVRSTCREVTDYALCNYKSPATCAACIYFVELLGQDSLALRASIVAANMLHDSQLSKDEKEHPEIERKFKQAYINKDAADSLIFELEQVIMKTWNPYNNDENAIMKDIVLWMPLMTLSHLYEVEAGSLYLNECAKHNQWLKFVVFAQIFQIAKEQVLKAASVFSDSCIAYHVFHSLHRHSSPVYDAAYETKTVPPLKVQKRDMRNSLYYRIGLKDLPPAETKKPSIPDSPIQDDVVSITSEDTSTSSDTDLRFVVLKDLFSQLLLAQKSDCPWDCLLHTCYEIQNPVLALLAVSYAEARLENCFFVWLYSTLCQSEEVQKEVEGSFSEVRVTNCSTDDVENLVLLAVRNHKILTLWKGVHLFLPNTPLTSLMGYLRSFIVYKNFKSSIETFQNQLWDYPKVSNESSVLLSLSWIEKISVSILKEAVIACTTSYERLIMLNHFFLTRVEKSFSKDVSVPQFMKVYRLVQYLGKLSEEVEVKSLFLPQEDPSYAATCWTAVEKLLSSHLYDEAQGFIATANLSQEKMLMLQINQETSEACKESYWNCLSYRSEFWRNIFAKLKVLPLQTAIDFVEEQCEVSDKCGEKYFLMKSLIELLKESGNSGAYILEALTKKMWWWCIKAEVNKELCPEIFDVEPVRNFDVQDILESHSSTHVNQIEDDREREALGSIIGQFLSKKDVGKAFNLAATFGYKCNDLFIIKTCFDLARGEKVDDSVDCSLPDVVSEVPSSRIIRSLLLWITAGSNAFSAAQKDTIKYIEKLSKKCTIAAPICHQILVHCAIAMVLDEDYESVSRERNALSILKRILVLKLKDEHVLAKSLIVVHELADKEVAKFLCEEIWHSLQKLGSSNLVMIPEEMNAFSEEVIYDPLRTMEGFQLIVKLCKDPSLLGTSLMGIFTVESAELTPNSSDQNFTLLADLCICAHECFTAACNMDGISQILHSSQMLVSLLEEADKFHIMVHLWVGIGRYSEMMYVLDILKSNDKLNILFEKDMENVPDLRLALLDYLKRYPASECDKYFYELASRFRMYREKAEILEMSVQKMLSQLCKKNTDNNMKEELEKALQVLSDAAKSYCEADCLHQAQNCMKLAQLIALQIYFVPAGIWIIGLNESSVTRFITDHDKFSQAYIVAEEYDKHHLWSQALLHNVVLRGDREYLNDFKSCISLSTSLITEVAKKYIKLPVKSESSLQNMKLLLSLCSNVKTKYSLASELGFSDMLSELLMGEASAYLQDLMANGSLR